MAHIAGNSIVKGQGTELSRADLERQADILRLSLMGHQGCELAWRQFERGDPAGARLVVEYVNQISVERQRANGRADELIMKAAKSMPKRKKARKLIKPVTKSMITKAAHSSATGGSYSGTSRGAALHAMWEQNLRSPDPAVREASWAFLYGGAHVR